jgi:hypothetical protein
MAERLGSSDWPGHGDVLHSALAISYVEGELLDQPVDPSARRLVGAAVPAVPRTWSCSVADPMGFKELGEMPRAGARVRDLPPGLRRTSHPERSSAEFGRGA